MQTIDSTVINNYIKPSHRKEVWKIDGLILSEWIQFHQFEKRKKFKFMITMFSEYIYA